MTSLNSLLTGINNIHPRRTVIFFLVAFVSVLALSCERAPQWNPIEKSVMMMDTFVSIRVFDEKPQELIEQSIQAALDRMQQIERLTSSFDSTSEVYRINQNAHKQFVPLSNTLKDILLLGIEVENRTQGAFTVTIAPLMQAWGFGPSGSFSVPSQQEIDSCLSLVGARWIEIKGSKIRFKKKVSLELGGIAKGYAVDQGIIELEKAGIENALIDAGGDLRALSGELTQGKRRVYVRHPRERTEFFGRFKQDEGAVATSGDYERYFISDSDSVRYHHLIDPKTGYPGRKCVSVTVVAPTCALADALSTAFFVLGPEKGMNIAEQWQGVEALIITEKNSRLAFYTSSGLANFDKK